MKISKILPLLLLAGDMICGMDIESFDAYNNKVTYQEEKKRHCLCCERDDFTFNFGLQAIRHFLETDDNEDQKRGVAALESIASHHSGAQYCLWCLCRNGVVEPSSDPTLSPYYKEFDKNLLSDPKFCQERTVVLPILSQLKAKLSEQKMEQFSGQK